MFVFLIIILLWFFILNLLFYQYTGAGATWSTFREPATVDDNFALAQAMGMLVFDTILYFLVAWYVDNVKPGDYGIPKPFYFPFTVSYTLYPFVLH